MIKYLMKTLIVYYSRTENNKNLAQYLQKDLNTDIEEIISKDNLQTTFSLVIALFKSLFKIGANIQSPTKNPWDYDLVLLVSPVRAWNISSPMFSYIKQNKKKFKQTAFATICWWPNPNLKDNLEKLLDKKLIWNLELYIKDLLWNNNDTKEIIKIKINNQILKDKFYDKIKPFINLLS